ncbi:hypothetical protein CFC21_097355 [Triticum aestivum]|uniref:Uncharacterized protein n=3 Tax=Triticum TaxID=4564 RepID=A0A9R0Z901_TRITD|nr:uncharacterized protein LOC123151392 [Triticum aestivum]KAF7095126.1 hypothetical protein CFC21_097355 [Triticum aestivum]VAI73551.1 unnamed protein product [Triticum turgidum subsp. durum]
MASLPQPLPYGSSYHPSAGSVRHTGRPAPDEGGGSFGPVLVVLAVVSFLSAAACIAGRLCGRRSSSSRGKSSAEQQSTADAEKGLGTAKCPAVMRPLPSSRATVHDMDDDDVFEIKFAHVKPPAEWEKHGAGGDGGGRVPALPQPLLGPPRQYAAAGFRCAPAPANGAGVARQAHPPQVRGAGDSCTAPARPTK